MQDVSGVGAPLDLTVADGTAVSWLPGGGLSIDASTAVVSSGSATKLFDGRRDTGEDSGAVAAVSAEQDEARDPADEAPAPSRPDGLRILYVEDNEDNIVLLQGRLLDRGYAVSIARNGREGIATARSERPDLILMDMSLPVMNGWDATRELKGDPATAAIPVIGVSAHAMAGDRDSALAAGCDDYVTKPIDIEELIEKARALVKMGDAEQP